MLALVAFWYWKRRADQALRRSELGLDQVRHSLLACQERLQQVSAQAEQAMQAARVECDRLRRALFDSEQRLGLQLDATGELVFVLDLDGRLQQLSRNWCEALGVASASLIGRNHAWLVHPDDLPACQGAIERALASRSPQGDVEYRIRHAGGNWRWHVARIAPLRDIDGRTVGLLGVARTPAGLYAGVQAHRQAHCDALTGLPASHLCLDRLQQALRQAERHASRLALLRVGIDGFRQLNERWGHAIGDLVLLESAARISASVRASDTVGRGSGGSFVVLLPDIGSEREALALADKIRLALREPLSLRGLSLKLTACVGVVVHPRHGLDEEDLAGAAEQALRCARAAGPDQVSLPQAEPLVPCAPAQAA